MVTGTVFRGDAPLPGGGVFFLESTNPSARESVPVPVSRESVPVPISQRVLIGLSTVLVILGAAAGVTTYRLKKEVGRLQGEVAAAAERDRVMDQQLTRERVEKLQAGAALRRERTSRAMPPPTRVVTLRSGPLGPHRQSPQIALNPDEELVTLELAMPATLSGVTFRAGLRSAPGDEFWMQSRLTLDGDRRVVVVRVPAAVLRPADYELSLRGVGPNGAADEPVYYYFAVSSGR